MINRDDILSMEYLKKTEYTGSHQGMRYRLEQAVVEDEKIKGYGLAGTFEFPDDPGGKKERAGIFFFRGRRGGCRRMDE